MDTTIEQFRSAMEQAGLPSPDVIIADGRIHRFGDDQICWYVRHHDDGNAWGAFGDWKSGIKQGWSSRSYSEMTTDERQAHNKRIEEAKRQAEDEASKRHKEARDRAARIWGEMEPASNDHPYLVKKQVSTNGLRLYRGNMSIKGRSMDGAVIAPIRDVDGVLWSLEFIMDDGGKFFLPGGQKRGCSYVLGEITETTKTIGAAEGLATGASVHEDTGLPVAIAFDAGNLRSVVEKLRERYRNASIVVCGDNDVSGRGQEAATEAAQAVGGVAAIPETPGKDWNDIHVESGPDAVRQAIEAALHAKDKDAGSSQAVEATSEKKSQATRLIDLADEAEMWHAPEGEAYATLRVGDHHEHHRLRQKGFKQWLAQRYYTVFKGAPSAQALNDALSVLEAKANFEGKEQNVFIRVAEHDGNIYLDLGNENWEVVKITATGWSVIENPPIAFRRPRGMLALPTPQADGDVTKLKDYVNLDSSNENAWRLLIACLLAMFRPTGPYPILIFNGEQGSAKSTALKILRALIDPNKSLLRTAPRDERDLMIAASNGWVLSYDNLSHLESWLSDGFCRLSTGGGLSTRELYSDSDELIIDVQRPVVFNGIEELATRGDLLDRAVLFNLPTIAKEKRRTEAEFWKEFEKDRPFILGALIDAVSGALKNLPSTKLDRLPRMADFATWATAAESSLGWTPGDFINSYTANQEEANDLTLSASPLTEPLKKLIDQFAVNGPWKVTATELLGALSDQVTDQTKRLKSWPAIARTLSNSLKRLQPNLRAAGISVKFLRVGRERSILLDRERNSSSSSSPSSHPETFQSISGDARGDAKRPGDANVTNGDASHFAHRHHATSQYIRPSDASDASDDGLPFRSGVREKVVEL